MVVWFKRLSLVFSIMMLFFVVGCGSQLEKPLTKEEVSEVENTEIDKDLKQLVRGGNNEAEKIEEKNGEKDVEQKSSIAANDGSERSNKNNKEEKNQASSSPLTDSKKRAATSVSTKTASTEYKTTSSVAKQEDTKSTITTKAATETNKKKESTTNSGTTQNNEHKAKATTTPQKKETKSNIKPSQQESQSKTEAKDETAPPKNTVVMSIVISNSEVPLPPTEVEIKDGDSVLDALIKVTKDKKIQMDYRGGQGATAYVEGIANVYEFDHGPGSGWMYRVNGVFPDRSAGIIPLYSGDRVEWLYTTDLGNDLGADLKPFRR